MSHARRFFPDNAPEDRCRAIVDGAGGPDFFRRPDWRQTLERAAGEPRGVYETDGERELAIRDELAKSRDCLNARLGGATVRHLALPWGVAGSLARSLVAGAGYVTAFAERPLRRRAVRAGDDPFGLMRLNGKFLDVPARRRTQVVLLDGLRPMTAVRPEPSSAVEAVTVFPSDVDVAIVAHDNLAALPATLASLTAAGCPPDRITVVDVLSTDGTAEWLAREWPRVRVRRLDRNDGPSPGRNVGITEATRRFVLLMDADVRIEPDAIRVLHAAMMSDPKIKIGSPIVVHAARPDVIQYAGGAIHYICEAVNPWRDRPLADRGAAPQDIGAAPTCALLLDRAASIDIGLFDERYFIGKEDGDFTHRMKMAGFKIWEHTTAIVLHNSRPRGTWLFYYQIRNRWHFILKNYQLRTMICLLPALIVYEPLQFVVLAAKGHLLTYLRAIGGLIALLPTLPRDRALARRIRRRGDRDLLVSAPIVVREDLAKNPFVRGGKAIYERALNAYWRLLTAIR